MIDINAKDMLAELRPCLALTSSNSSRLGVMKIREGGRARE